MIRIACCDDDKKQLETVTSMIVSWDQSPVVFHLDTFDEGDALISAHLKNPYDIILLDIVMPLLNGLDIAKEIRSQDKSVKIVFLTSSREFAFESYRVKASDYLLKPVVMEELRSCLLERINEISTVDRFITITNGGIHHRIILSDVEYLEAQGKHVEISMKNGCKLKANEALNTFEKHFEGDFEFFKCHRSFIINLSQVSSYSAKEITMRSHSVIPLSRNLIKEFEGAYFTALFGKAGA
ncbi:MAG: response regulator transcription factor [Erysipelotrichaceae bacterium]|nr:response regulator transcription factor [Erysipelotrichaceae bacterium]